MTRIGIASHSHAQQAAVLGLKDLLDFAGSCLANSPLNVDIVTSYAPDDRRSFDVVILPPSLKGRLSGRDLQAVSSWIKRQHASGALVCSICAGAFPLAEAGLLDGRSATTHWGLAGAFAHQFPEVRLEAEKIIVDEGDIITAGGLMAWTDLGLRLIARFCGLAVMQETARMFLIDPGEREQSYYNLFSPNLTHGDAPVVKAQHWVQANYQTAVTVPQMAAAAGQEERTFLRRFQAATGFNPSEYLQQLRVAKAREHLELTSQSIETIAAEVGYLDTSSFRKLFSRIVGLSPREYRKRFAPVRRKN
ncbi:MAG: helix-turn-helix domain-containing protein [Rhodobacteraceae bacterium]|nr:helix-turn-helix domain-containing protein [Paracoccaceae bacterium]